MSVYSFKYKVLNRETGRKVSVTRWRVQIRKGGENINKVFDDESTARSFEEQELKRIDSGVPQNLIFDMKYQMEMPNMRTLLKDYFEKFMSKHSESSFKTNHNRCLSAIPSIPVYFKDIGAKIDNYRYQNTIVDAIFSPPYLSSHTKNGMSNATVNLIAKSIAHHARAQNTIATQMTLPRYVIRESPPTALQSTFRLVRRFR